MKILLFGDAVLGKNIKWQIDPEASFLLFNLEAPVINKGDVAAKKAGPHLSSLELALPGTGRIPAPVANLANNHIMDYGLKGLKRTLSQCRKKKVLTVGAGKNVEAARAPIVTTAGGKRIGVIGCCEEQFGIATFCRPGAAGVGPWVYSALRELSGRTDLVIVSIHGAVEMSPWPSPQWQELLRSFVDAGAGIVHGHHAHIPQGYEKYKGGLIFYGLGNFVVDPKVWPGQPNALWSVIPEIEAAGGEWEHRINTAVISAAGENSILVRRSNPAERSAHIKYLEICNRPLKDKKLLAALWQEVSVRMYQRYYAQYLSTPKDFLLGYHLFACQSHREAISTALGILGGELPDLRTAETRGLADKWIR